TAVGPHVLILGPNKIGKNNRVIPFSGIGQECKDKKYDGERTTLIVDGNNVFRESCTFHHGTVHHIRPTLVGPNHLFKLNVHVAHDAVVDSNCILANDTNIAGHVQVGDWAILGGATQVHQFCKIGADSMCGAGTVVLKDIPAYVMALGYPAEPHGI